MAPLSALPNSPITPASAVFLLLCFEIEAPLNVLGNAAEAVPMGLPADASAPPAGAAIPSNAAVPIGEAVPMGGAISPAPLSSNRPPVAAPPLRTAPTPLSVLPPPPLNPSTRAGAVDATSTLGAAVAAVGIARDLGIQPKDALRGAQQGAQIAKELGVTPSQALAAGVAAAKWLGPLMKSAR